MAPFYGWGSTASRLQPLRGGSLLFTIQFPEITELALLKGKLTSLNLKGFSNILEYKQVQSNTISQNDYQKCFPESLKKLSFFKS